MRNLHIRPIMTPEEERDKHSPIGFSGWERHSACHGSVALASLCPPSPPSDASSEGIIAHAFASEWLVKGYAPKGLDSVMQANLQHYVNAVWNTLPKSGISRSIWLVEGRVHAPSIHEECWGTVDSLIWDDDTKILKVHDLKYGGYKVDVENNKQLMGYAICAIEEFKLKPKSVELYIHQPKISHEPQKWECDLMDLEMFEDEIRDEVALIDKQRKLLKKTKDPMKLDLHAGDHCRFCPAWSTCHERIAAAKREGVDLLLPVPDELPKNAGKVVAFALKALPWAANVLKNAKAHLLKGGTIPGALLVKGKRVRVAKDPETFIDTLTTEEDFGGLGLSERDVMVTPEPKPMTIPQLEKVIPKDKKKAFRELWDWQDGAPQLALEGDKREPYKVRPEDYFKEIEEDSEQDDF